FEHVYILTAQSIKAMTTRAGADSGNGYSTIAASIESDLAQWLFKSAAQDVDASGLVTGSNLHFIQSGNGGNQHGTTAGNDTLFNSGAGRRKGILNTMLLLFQFDLSSSADFDHAYAAGKLGQALLELLAIVVAGCPLDECTDLAYTSLDLIS